MGFFNPLDVITAGAGALPGTGVSQAAINAGKVNAPAVGQGSLGALGGGGRPMTGIDWDQHPIGSRPGEPGFDPNKGFNQILYPGGQLPPDWQPNTGGINPNSPQPVPGMPPKQFDPNTPQWTPPEWGDPSTWSHTMNGGSLQSLGGGQLNQSGMVTLRGPDGSSKAVPQSDLSHWLSKGAVRA